MKTLKKTTAYYKDPSSGEFKSFNIMGEKTAAEITAEIEATGQEVEAKAQEALASIPEDYTALVEQVDQLSGEIDDNVGGCIKVAIQNGAYPYATFEKHISKDDIIYLYITDTNMSFNRACVYYGNDENVGHNGTWLCNVSEDNNKVVIKMPTNCEYIGIVWFLDNAPETEFKSNFIVVNSAENNLIGFIGNEYVNRLYDKYKGKRISILGDSWSTFKGFTTPKNNSQWYPPSDNTTDGTNNNVENVTDTWWHKLAKLCRMFILDNNSYSGSCVAYDGDVVQSSFVKRVENMEFGEVVIIEGGTNDSGSNINIGAYKYDNFTEEDFKFFRPSVAYVIDYIKKHSPSSELLFLVNEDISDEYKESIYNICVHYGVSYVLLPTTLEKQNAHPSINGMNIITNIVIDELEKKFVLTKLY